MKKKDEEMQRKGRRTTAVNKRHARACIVSVAVVSGTPDVRVKQNVRGTLHLNSLFPQADTTLLQSLILRSGPEERKNPKFQPLKITHTRDAQHAFGGDVRGCWHSHSMLDAKREGYVLNQRELPCVEDHGHVVKLEEEFLFP